MRIPPHHDRACWGCGDTPEQLHLPLPVEDGQTEYEAYLHFDERHQGGPGLVHGGVVSAALDEGHEPLAEARSAFLHVCARALPRHAGGARGGRALARD
jgi:hypothetical protein